MLRNSKQLGFTLLEIMVVVFIVATMAGLSFFALNQASDRRYSSQAKDFLVWLEQLSDLAMLEGSAYGVAAAEQGFQAVVFYNYDWYEVSLPEPFYFDDEVRLSLVEGNDYEGEVINRKNNSVNQNRAQLPSIIMQADGYIEPDANLSLAFENYSPMFIYRQEENGFELAIERSLR
ncbi:MAG: type II secretion system protein [Gammaproteobacteria bacterium]|jgi:prepilin-type N-terminal cleavage/methylation domain-containing protein|nr:type II secretion system protein [Gammaproteobacteria bacterium]